MEKKFDIENDLEMLLDDQLVKEAELLEKELFADDNFEDYQETPEEREASKEKLVNRLKEDGIYREETIKEFKGKEYTSVETGNKVSKNNGAKRNKKVERFVARAAGVVIVSGLCVFAASMSSEANRNYLLHNIRVLSGNDTRVVNSNDERNDLVRADEYAAITEIEKKLQVEVPEFYYRPENFEFASYEADSIAGIAWMEFKYKNNIVILEINNDQSISSSNISGVHGQEVEIIKMLYDDIEIELIEIHDSNEKIPSYYANWKKNNVNYILTGRIELKELKNILSKMAY